MGISKVGKAAKQKELPLVVDGKAKWYHHFEKDGDVLIWETIISLSMGAPDCCVGEIACRRAVEGMGLNVNG